MGPNPSFLGKWETTSRKCPQQHRWVIDGNRLLTGKDCINCIKLRVNALPTRSRTTRGRNEDRLCGAGCNAPESLDHILQICHRNHKARIARHNAVVNYVKRALEKHHSTVEAEPIFKTNQGTRKPDLIAIHDNRAILLDAQVVSGSSDLGLAHKRKIQYHQDLMEPIKVRYNATDVMVNTITLNNRGIWHGRSANFLVTENILKKDELKIISTRVLVSGLMRFGRWTKCTSYKHVREGIG